jgi:hypothetical protein
MYQKTIEMLIKGENGQIKGQKLTPKERQIGVIRLPYGKFKFAVKLSEESLLTLVDEVLSGDRDLKSFSTEAQRIKKLTVSI